jgi:hypothetical protein
MVVVVVVVEDVLDVDDVVDVVVGPGSGVMSTAKPIRAQGEITGSVEVEVL